MGDWKVRKLGAALGAEITGGSPAMRELGK